MRLHTYFSSRAGFRVRTALDMKGLAREDASRRLAKADPDATADEVIE